MKRALLVVAVLSVGLPEVVEARVGGGSSYSGSRSSSSSSRSSSSSSGSRSSSSSSHSSGSSSWSHSDSSSYGGGGGTGDLGSFFAAMVVLFVLVLLLVLIRMFNSGQNTGRAEFISSVEPERPSPPSARVQAASPGPRLRRFDPSFSEPVFLEWVSLLYVRAQEARGAGELEVLTPYFTPQALREFEDRDEGGAISKVRGVVLGSVKLVELTSRGAELDLTVAFHANYTVSNQAGPDQAYYAHEQWTLTRGRAVTSRAPADVEKLGCPSCGSPVERTALDRCVHCNAVYTPGTLDWTVSAVELQELETRPPLLTGEVEEIGTDWPTVKSPMLTAKLKELQASDASFNFEAFEPVARRLFLALQDGWTHQRWQTLRPNETDAVFQSHRFWLEEYRRQGLRNVLEQVKLTRVEPVKVELDKYYESITCRMHASMLDSTVNVATKRVVGGNARKVRAFTEYWTFIRARGLHTRPGGVPAEVKCPNCGAPLTISQSGVCESCDAKVTRGDFGWVLSRIEQDEEYTG